MTQRHTHRACALPDLVAAGAELSEVDRLSLLRHMSALSLYESDPVLARWWSAMADVVRESEALAKHRHTDLEARFLDVIADEWP